MKERQKRFLHEVGKLLNEAIARYDLTLHEGVDVLVTLAAASSIRSTPSDPKLGIEDGFRTYCRQLQAQIKAHNIQGISVQDFTRGGNSNG